MADESSEESSSTATSLEEKMKSWEASEEEIKAATLGGVVPGGGSSEGRTDAFDVGLYIMFPVMVISCLAVSTGELFVYDVQHDQFRFTNSNIYTLFHIQFVFFPLIIGNIDVTSVGPPPTS